MVKCKTPSCWELRNRAAAEQNQGFWWVQSAPSMFFTGCSGAILSLSYELDSLV